MEFRPDVKDLSKNVDKEKLISSLSELASQLDILYTESAPNGSISSRQGRFSLYKNGSSYEVWINTDGATTWQRIDKDSLSLSGYMQYSDTRFKVVTVTRDMSIADGTQTIAGAGFPPKAAIIIAIDSDNLVTASIGIDDGTTHLCMAANGAVAGQWLGGYSGSSFSVSMYKINGTVGNAYEGYLSPFNDDGSVMNWDKTGTPTGTLTCKIIFFR